ncbi:MAG: hypothetical protein KC486_07545 [Myxococcales bacterium]|nr:hypothetical protein [Myxococcales bacterium]
MAAQQRGRRAHWRLLGGLALVLSLGFGLGACKPKERPLAPPAGTPAMDVSHVAYFDRGITTAPVVLVGRSPSDVVDQRLFGQRLGYADLVVVATVEESWERRRGADVRHFVQVRLGEPLLYELPKKTAETLRLEVVSEDPLGDLRGETFVLFVRWSPGERPPFRHHLMIADQETIELIQGMVGHAIEAGQLDRRAGKRKKGRGGKRGANGEAKGAAKAGGK